MRRMDYLPSDDQFRSAPASSADITGRCVGDCTIESTFTALHHRRSAGGNNIPALPASSVLVRTDTGLGSPTPTVFLAKTLNSYSTQAFRSTTVAVNVLPSMISGTESKIQQ